MRDACIWSAGSQSGLCGRVNQVAGEPGGCENTSDSGGPAGGRTVCGAGPARRGGRGTSAFSVPRVDVPEATGTQVNSVNDRGTIEGEFTDASGQHRFVDAPAAWPGPTSREPRA